LIYIDPDEIFLDPVTWVRRETFAYKDERVRIERLADTIAEEGQLQPILVRRKNGHYAVVCGRRRIAAISELKRRGMPLLVASYVTQMDDAEAYRAALIENIQRRNFTPVAFARLIADVRAKNQWQSGDHTKDVARFFGVSPAQITTHERLLELPVEIQERVESDGWAAQCAFDLAAVEPEHRQAVIGLAQDLAQAEEKKKRKKALSEGKVKGGVKTIQSSTDDSQVAPPTPPIEPTGQVNVNSSGSVDPADDSSASSHMPVDEAKAKVKRKHILAAARITPGALQQDKARTRKEIIEFFTELTGPAYPPLMRNFASHFVDSYCPGKTDEKALLNRWNAIASAVEDKQPRVKKSLKSVSTQKQAAKGAGKTASKVAARKKPAPSKR
jgi:ParB/RepB/Spo0J family partition protein